MATAKKGTKSNVMQNKPDEEKKEISEQKQDSRIIARVDKIFDDPNSKLKATVSASLPGGFAVHGIKVYENEKGRWISMPQSSYKNSAGETKYEDIFHPVTAESRNQLNDAVSSAYDNALLQRQTEGQTEDQTDPSADEDLGIKM